MGRLERLAAVGAALAVLLEAALLNSGSLVAQEPDSAAVQVPDSVVQAADSVPGPDTLTVPIFPTFPDPASRSPAVAAQWTQHDLMMTGALTFAHLLEYTPVLDLVRAGFLEGPRVSVFAGRGPASFRFTQDGYEIAPVLGGALDQNLISLVEQQGIRLIAGPGGYRAYSQTYRNERRDAYSRIEAGTGNRRTNLIRAFFASRLSSAPIAFGLDRVDTRGLPETGESTRTVVWANLAHTLPLGIWGQVEFRAMTAERDSFPDPKRTDWIFRLRRPFKAGWHADITAGTASVERQALDDPTVPDSLESPLKRTADQVALRIAKSADTWQAYVSTRWWNGEDLPTLESDVSFELGIGPAALYAAGRYANWDGSHEGAIFASLLFDLPLGAKALLEAEEGDRRLFGRLPISWMEFSRWTAGLEIKLRSWRVGARGGRWRSTPSPGLGVPIDSLTSVAGGTVWVREVWASGPVFKLFGGVVEAGGRFSEREQGPYVYWPRDSWRLEGKYRVIALADQLEVVVTGMGGIRGSMFVMDREIQPGLVIPTGDLNWWRAEAVVRIKDFHIWYNYEFFDSSGIAGEVPGFGLPLNRYHFGVKWEFWN